MGEPEAPLPVPDAVGCERAGGSLYELFAEFNNYAEGMVSQWNFHFCAAVQCHVAEVIGGVALAYLAERFIRQKKVVQLLKLSSTSDVLPVELQHVPYVHTLSPRSASSSHEDMVEYLQWFWVCGT